MKKNYAPPKVFLKFFRWYCRPRLADHIEGDLQEVYRKRLLNKGKRFADVKFILDVLLLIRPGIVKQMNGHRNMSTMSMYKSYVTMGWRTLLKNKGYSFINVGGLALGMSVAVLIGMWMYDEISFNKYHQNYDRIAQVRNLETDPYTGITDGGNVMSLPVAAALKNNYHQYFDHILIAYWPGSFTLAIAEKKFSRSGLFIEPGAPDMLSLEMIKGTRAALSDPHSIILSKTTADALFGNTDPINQNLVIDNHMEATVAGVYQDIPSNARFGDMGFFAPWALLQMSNDWMQRAETHWGYNSFHIYVQLKSGVSMAAAAEGIKDFYIHSGPKEWAEGYIATYKPELLLYPMAQWHLYSDFKDARPAGGRITFVWLFGIVGVFVLLLACINFTNLTTARSEKRAREVGVRKAIGSQRSSLIQQFLIESFLVVVLAFVVSLALVSLALPFFNELSAKKLMLPFNVPAFWMISSAFLLIAGLMASLYPAFYLSSFQPIRVLKGTFRAGRFSALPRKTLVVIQFTVSITLIIGTAIVYQQIQFARSRPLGYSREGLISVPKKDPGFKGKLDALRNELKNTGAVEEVAYSNSSITDIWNGVDGFEWTGKLPGEASDFSITDVTHEYGEMVQWDFISGRNFSRSLASDSSGVIINETAAQYMKLKNPIGETVKNSGKTWQIIGVIKDMIMTSPYKPVKRAFFFLHNDPDEASQIHMKINPAVSASVAIPKVQRIFKNLVPSASFDYQFVDEQYAAKFAQEERIGKLSSLFTLLAVFISCLGLFGLASFMAEQRTKEIGVRKVLGASVFNLWKMLSKDFVYLVLISIATSIPIAFYVMKTWLMNYHYRTDMHWQIFAASGVTALLITLLTVSYQSVKAAMGNPVDSLRSE